MHIGFMEFDVTTLSRIKKVCNDTYSKDKSFRFKIKDSKFERDKILMVFSKDVNIAHKRMMWLIKKVLKGENDGHDFIYWVKET